MTDFLDLEQRAAEMPAAIALCSPEQGAVTYLDLERRLRAMQREVADAGLGPGEVAAIVLPNGPDLIVALLAVAASGAAAPLNPLYTES